MLGTLYLVRGRIDEQTIHVLEYHVSLRGANKYVRSTTVGLSIARLVG